MPLHNPTTYPDIDPSRNVYVDLNGFTTVQAAVTYAETLAGADEEDETGVMVHVPAGFFDETVTIKKNVGLTGAGQEVTKITAVTCRPASNTLAPKAIHLFGVWVVTLTTTNETGPASGVFNLLSMFNIVGQLDAGLRVEKCRVDYYDIRNCFYVRFDSCQMGFNGGDDLVSLNIEDMGFRHCSFASNILHSMDASDAHKAYHLLDPEDMGSDHTLAGTLRIDGCSTFGQVAIRTLDDPTFYQAVLVSTNNFIATIDLGANTASGIRSTGFLTLTKDPTATAGIACTQGYTPTTLGDWSAAPVNVDNALDALASRVKVLEGVVLDVIDTFTGSANGATQDAHTTPVKNFSLQVEKTGAVSLWTVILEGSNDGVVFSTIATHTQATGDGIILWANGYTSAYFRTRCTGITGGTNVIAHVVATTN